MIRLGNIDRWTALPKGMVLSLPGKEVRRVLLTVNSPGVAALYIQHCDGELQFLAAPDRMDTVEFYHEGDVKITTDAEDVFILSAENEVDYVVIEDAEVFTEIATRAARNPELEKLLHLQQVNTERRLAAIMEGYEGRINEAFDAGRRANSGRTEGTPPDNDAGKKPEPDQKRSESGAPAATAVPANDTGKTGD